MEKRKTRYKKGNALNKKKIAGTLIFLIIVLGITLLVLQRTGAIFQTTTESEASLDIAFYCIEEDYQSMTLKLDDIIPRTAPYTYNFSVSNNNGTKRTETNLTYDLTIRTTTNLPINFSLYDTNNGATLIGIETITQDDDNTYFRYINIPQREFGFVNNQTDNSRISIVLPTTYRSDDYQDIIELVEINVDSKQKI